MSPRSTGYGRTSTGHALVVLASTHDAAIDVVPLEALRSHAVDVPAGPGELGDPGGA